MEVDLKNWEDLTKQDLINLLENGLWYQGVSELYNKLENTVRKRCKGLGINAKDLINPNKKVKEDKSGICKVCGKHYKTSKNLGYCSSNCVTKEKSLNELDNLNEPTTELGKSIFELKRLGKTHSEIANEIGCSKSTVAYWCNHTTSKKSLELKKKKREVRDINYLFSRRVSAFKEDRSKRKKGVGKITSANRKSDWRKIYCTKIINFRDRNKLEVEKIYNYDTALIHLGGIETKCYLTGRPINIETDDYCLDHIIPASKGGSNELENMGITTPEANASKTDLTLEEYLELCKTVLQNFGYTVTK